MKHYPQWQKKFETIFSKIRNNSRVFTLTTTNQYKLGGPSHSNQRRRRKVIQNGKKKKKIVKPSLLVDDMILCMEIPKDTTRKLLELIISTIVFQNTKLIHRNSLHSYKLKNWKKKREIKEINPFITAIKIIHYSGIILS